MTPAREYWKLLDRKPDPRHKRTSHIKVRTGCITCKGRRVKCDERKPHCGRCERAHIECGGYVNYTEKPKASPPSSQGVHAQALEPARLRPKPVQRRIIYSAEPPAASLELRATLSPVLLSGRDVSYLDAFRYHMVDDFNSWLTPGFWDNIVMRESMEDETIRHSILGLSAMTRVGWFTREQSDEVAACPDAALNFSRDDRSLSEHHQAALSHYAKAISSCRQKLASGSSEVEGHELKRLLISTIVFILIEMMQGNIKSAIDLVDNGLQLIQKAALKNGPTQSDQELAMAELIFSRFSIIGGLGPCFSSKKETGMSMPPMRNVTLPPALASADALLEAWNRSFRPIQPFMLKSAFGHQITDEDLEDFTRKLDHRVINLDQWQGLVETHLKKTRDAKTRRSLILTKVQLLITKIHLTYCQKKTTLAYDAHIRDFEEIVRLSETFTASDLMGRLRFTVDFNLFPWLGFTIARCRDFQVRKAALDTFTRLVFRQGGWGNLGVLKALRAVVSIDDQWLNEDGSENGPARYSWTLSRWDFEKRKIWVRFDPVPEHSSAQLGAFMLMRQVGIDY